jgi:hypothetical protein
MSKTVQTARIQPEATPPWTTDLVGVGAAAVCAMVTWVFTVQLADLDLIVEAGGEVQRVTGWAVALTAGVAALIGYLALRVLERLTPRALGIWTVLAVVMTLVSFLGPLSATSAAATGTLIALHAVVAAVVIASARSSRRRRRPRGGGDSAIDG